MYKKSLPGKPENVLQVSDTHGELNMKIAPPAQYVKYKPAVTRLTMYTAGN